MRSTAIAPIPDMKGKKTYAFKCRCCEASDLRESYWRSEADKQIRNADVLCEEESSILCKTCSAPAEEAYEPYCMSCSLYWRDVDNGLFDD